MTKTRTVLAPDGTRLVFDELGSTEAPAVILLHGGGHRSSSAFSRPVDLKSRGAAPGTQARPRLRASARLWCRTGAARVREVAGCLTGRDWAKFDGVGLERFCDRGRFHLHV